MPICVHPWFASGLCLPGYLRPSAVDGVASSAWGGEARFLTAFGMTPHVDLVRHSYIITAMDEKFPQLANLSRGELIGLIEDSARNWLAHDGLWFQAVERAHGMDAAMRADAEAWRVFTTIEAKRIMARHGIAPGGGIPALVKALSLRLYAFLNVQETTEQSDNRVVFRMRDCRVQSARKRKGLPDFPCKPVGLVEYEWFARTIDPRIETRCICCPPDAHPDDVWCAWEFTLKSEG